MTITSPHSEKMTTTYDIHEASLYDDRKDAFRAARALDKELKRMYVFRDYCYTPKLSPCGKGFVLEVLVEMANEWHLKGWLREDSAKNTERG